MEKDSKAAVLYFKPRSIGRAGGARCGACWKFIPQTSGCVEVTGTIKAGGVCGLYVNGMPHHDVDSFRWKIKQVSQEEAGYTDEGDSHCMSCEYMRNPNEPSSPCHKVQGYVEQQGCCNEYEQR
jgi:hypothetical protein